MGRSLITDYFDSFRDPSFWMYSTWLEIVTKYRKSRLGLFWALFPPILYTFGVGWFFAHLQRTDPLLFIPHLGIGYVVFRLVTVSLNEATTAYSSHSGFILDGRTRLTDYVLRVAAKASFYVLVAAPVLVVALAVSPAFHWSGLATLIPAILLVLLNIAWMGIVVSIIGARFHDMYELMGSVLMFSFLFTPILWTAEHAPIDSLRGGIARANPLFHLVEVVRAPLLGVDIEPLTLIYLPCLLVAGWGLAMFLYRRYARFVPVWI